MLRRRERSSEAEKEGAHRFNLKVLFCLMLGTRTFRPQGAESAKAVSISRDNRTD